MIKNQILALMADGRERTYDDIRLNLSLSGQAATYWLNRLCRSGDLTRDVVLGEIQIYRRPLQQIPDGLTPEEVYAERLRRLAAEEGHEPGMPDNSTRDVFDSEKSRQRIMDLTAQGKTPEQIRAMSHGRYSLEAIAHHLAEGAAE